MSQVQIAAFNTSSLFRGLVVTGTKRISDILNDRLSPTIKMLDIRIHHLADLTKPVFSADEFFLRKERFDIYAILREERSVMTGRLYAYVPKERRPVTIFMSGFKIEGEIHLKASKTNNPTSSLLREGELFIPVTDATLSHLHNPRLRLPAPTLLLRESALEAFSLAEDRFLSHPR